MRAMRDAPDKSGTGEGLHPSADGGAVIVGRSAAVILTLPERGGSLFAEAERFAARTKAARDAILDSLPPRSIGPGGYDVTRRSRQRITIGWGTEPADGGREADPPPRRAGGPGRIELRGAGGWSQSTSAETAMSASRMAAGPAVERLPHQWCTRHLQPGRARLAAAGRRDRDQQRQAGQPGDGADRGAQHRGGDVDRSGAAGLRHHRRHHHRRRPALALEPDRRALARGADPADRDRGRARGGRTRPPR